MNRIFVISLAAAAVFASCKGTASPDEQKKFNPDDYVAETTGGTLLRSACADPCLLYNGGKFFLTSTGSKRIAVIQSETLKGLATASGTIAYDGNKDPNVTAMFGSGATLGGTWSPEIHIISDDDCPGYGGTYLLVALRQNLETSKNVRPVILKSETGAIAGPYCHPVTMTQDSSSPLLDADGNPVTYWSIGMSYLRIPSGKYKGLYGTFVDEVGRGTGKGNFYQRLRIARMKNPWQLATEMSTITQPTQEWEKKGSSSSLPEVVEGGTAIYGDNGEVFLTYCGSGYWSDYGQGQLTLKKEGGDYCDPLQTSSWLKCEKNPRFTSRLSDEIRGAGHAFFLKDDAGNRFFVYHAYGWDGTKKSDNRHAYIEPYSIDYSKTYDSAPYGLLMLGENGGAAAPTSTPVTFYKKKK